MNIYRIICLLGLGTILASPAHGALDRIEDTLEVDRTQVDLPSYTTDRVVVRPCEGCDVRILQVNENTVYRLAVKGESVDLQTFREAAFKRPARDTLMYITYALDGETIKHIVLGAPPPASAE